MAKIEVTKDLIRRLSERINHHCACGNGEYRWDDFELAVREALNPPPEPQVEITKEMLREGGYSINALMGYAPDAAYGQLHAGHVYRAMRPLEPKKTSAHQQFEPRILFEGFKDNKMLYSISMVEKYTKPAGEPR